MNLNFQIDSSGPKALFYFLVYALGVYKMFEITWSVCKLILKV